MCGIIGGDLKHIGLLLLCYPSLVGKNKHNRKVIATNQLRIEEHRRKITAELEKPHPDYGLIEHWLSEIRAFEITIARRLKRLSKGK